MKNSFTLVLAIFLFFSSYSQITWNAQTSGVAVSLNGVAWSGSIFVAVGANGTILTSPTGVNWTAQTSGTTNTLNGVSYVNGLFIATGNTTTVLTSPDGITWTPQTVLGVNYFGASYGNGEYVLAASSIGATGVIGRSADGATWTQSLIPGAGVGFRSIAFASNLFIAVSASASVVATSVTGTTWTRRIVAIPVPMSSITASPTAFIAVGNTGQISTTVNGIAWTSQVSGTVNNLLGITEIGTSDFVAVGQNGTILLSTDGLTWAPETSGVVNALNAVTHSGSAFIAVGANGTILRSSFVLPVSLVSFSAKEEGQYRLLQWQTASEINTSHFEVEKSDDGNSFYSIGTVTAAGNSSVEHSYTFTDTARAFAVSYYRLKQVDLNGHFEYSKVVKLAAKNTQRLGLHPNPVSSRLFVSTLTLNDPFYIIGTSGRVVKTGLLNPSQGIDVSALPSGMYLLKLGNRTESFVKH